MWKASKTSLFQRQSKNYYHSQNDQGLSSIRDYAKLAKPLIIHLRREEGGGHITKNESAKTHVNRNQEAVEAFQKLKDILTGEDVLTYLNFKQEFHLTTDGSNYAIGAVWKTVNFI